jgi:hypothetical protein
MHEIRKIAIRDISTSASGTIVFIIRSVVKRTTKTHSLPDLIAESKRLCDQSALLAEQARILSGKINDLDVRNRKVNLRKGK